MALSCKLNLASFLAEMKFQDRAECGNKKMQCYTSLIFLCYVMFKFDTFEVVFFPEGCLNLKSELAMGLRQATILGCACIPIPYNLCPSARTPARLS